MLLVCLNWIYILFTTICLGSSFAIITQKIFHYKIKRTDSIIAIGIVIAAVYAQFFSIFYKVGMVANAVLVIICVISCIINKKEILLHIKKICDEFSVPKAIITTILFIIWAYFTSRGIIHYDTDLYHAQSIRWIEEYGVVPGLGNLHVRFAYNSSIFALTALYSMKFLLGSSLHTLCGFFAFILSITVLDISKSFKTKKLRLSDFARIGAAYYLTLICDEVVSPASDYATMCAVFYLMIKWLVQLESTPEEDENNITPYALICIGGVFAVSLKLTSGLILLLVVKPAYELIKNKNWRDIFIYIFMGCMVIAPWLIRTVIISGYLLYPFPALDIFSVDWKIPVDKAISDSAEIKTWGRAIYDASKVDMPITKWFPNWFNTTLSTTEKAIILADMMGVVIFIISLAVAVIRRKKEEFDKLLVMATIMSSYLFWLVSAPLLRYGYAYAMLMLVIPVGYVYDKIFSYYSFTSLDAYTIKNYKIKSLKLMLYGVYYFIILFGIVKLIPLGKYAVSVGTQPYYYVQKDYGVYQTYSCEIDGQTFYYPKESDRIGYEPFPSSVGVPDIVLRGNDIKSGFRYKQ